LSIHTKITKNCQNFQNTQHSIGIYDAPNLSFIRVPISNCIYKSQLNETCLMSLLSSNFKGF